MLENYRRTLKAPGVTVLAISSILARMPLALIPLALVLYLHRETHSFAAGGAAAGAFTASLAVTRPLWGRVIDRRGSARLVVGGAVAVCAALLGIVALGVNAAQSGAPIAFAICAGAASPPIGGMIRRLWPLFVTRDDDRVRAYSLDAVALELIALLGPPLAAGLFTSVGPKAPLLAAALCSIVGSSWFAFLAKRHQSPAVDPSHALRSPLSSPGVCVVIISGFPSGAAIGALDVALPAFATSHGIASLSGVFVGAIALGSVCGGLLYGAVAGLGISPLRSYVGLTLLSPFTVLPLLATSSPAAVCALAVLAGCWVAPLLAVRSQLVSTMIPPGTETETFTWVSLGLSVGVSGGAAAAGALIASDRWRLGIILACVLAASSIVVMLIGRGTLHNSDRSQPVSV